MEILTSFPHTKFTPPNMKHLGDGLLYHPLVYIKYSIKMSLIPPLFARSRMNYVS